MKYVEYVQRKFSGKKSILRVSMPPEMQTKELRVATSAATMDLTPQTTRKYWLRIVVEKAIPHIV